MAKIFTTNGTGASQTLDEASSNRLKVYDDYEDIDTTELVDGEIVSTKENAGANVYDYVNELINSKVDYGPDYANGVTTTLSTQSGSTSTGSLTYTYTATEECYIVFRHWIQNGGAVNECVKVNVYWGDTAGDASNSINNNSFVGYGAGVDSSPIRLFAGDKVTCTYAGYNDRGYSKNYTVYPVKRGN